MLTKDFQHGDIIGRVKRWHPRLGEFDKALYLRSLAKIYSGGASGIGDALTASIDSEGNADVQPNLAGLMNPDVLAAFTIFGELDAFASLAAHVDILTGTGYDWPKPLHSADKINAAFCDYLEDTTGVWKVIADLAKELDRPNGAAGSPKEALSESEKADPLSLLPDMSTPKESAAD